MILAWEWLKANWRYVGCVVFGIVIGSLASLSKTDNLPKLAIEAKQAQSGTLENTAHFTIKPMPKLPNDPCPQLPEVTVDCGGKASGSQNQAVSATASLTQIAQFGVWAGLGASQQTVYGSAMLTYGRWALTGQYGINGVYGGDVKFKALEF